MSILCWDNMRPDSTRWKVSPYEERNCNWVAVYDFDKEKEGIVSIRYTGNGFLYNMVRILTGTLIEVGRGLRKPSEMQEIIDAMDRGAAGFTAPAQGLYLVEVEY